MDFPTFFHGDLPIFSGDLSIVCHRAEDSAGNSTAAVARMLRVTTVDDDGYLSDRCWISIYVYIIIYNYLSIYLSVYLSIYLSIDLFNLI